MRSGRASRSCLLRSTADCRRRLSSPRPSSAVICHRPRDCKSVRTHSGRASRARARASRARARALTPGIVTPRPRTAKRSRYATPRSASPVRPPSWRCCVTCSTPFADPAEPRWTAFERLLRHVITHWESTPRHHDPVFARDGWRCTVPACSSRRNLHDHHHPLPLARRRQPARQPHRGLRGASSARHP